MPKIILPNPSMCLHLIETEQDDQLFLHERSNLTFPMNVVQCDSSPHYSPNTSDEGAVHSEPKPPQGSNQNKIIYPNLNHLWTIQKINHEKIHTHCELTGTLNASPLSVPTSSPPEPFVCEEKRKLQSDRAARTCLPRRVPSVHPYRVAAEEPAGGGGEAGARVGERRRGEE
jgi:hypothetical protein